MKMKSFRLLLFIALSILLSINGCVHIEFRHSGIVKDAETQKPLNDAVVLIDLEYGCILPPAAHKNTEKLGSIETSTNADGEYRSPSRMFFLPPLLCVKHKSFTYSKPGYFTRHEPSSQDQVYLYRMIHFINYRSFLDRHRQSSSYYNRLEEESMLYKKELDKLKRRVLYPADERGVFLRMAGRRFTRIYSQRIRTGQLGKYPGHMIYHVYDDNSKEWITLDSRGRTLELEATDTEWTYFSSRPTWGDPIYANSDAVFFPARHLPVLRGQESATGTKHIVPHKGSISALSGFAHHFFTIEDNGAFLCNYNYAPDREGGKFIPHCLSGNDLPISEEDDSLKDAVFEYMVPTQSSGETFIVVSTSKFRHIYKRRYSYDMKTKKNEIQFIKIHSFPVDKEITAFTATNYEFFVAFKNEGIRKYTIKNLTGRGGPYAKEYPAFFGNSKSARYSDVKSMLIGYAINTLALYATTGEDKIYRFSLDGTPDFLIKFPEGD